MFSIPTIFDVYLFDMDGTLVDTEPIGPQVFKTLFNKYGVELSEDEKLLFIKVWRRTGTKIKEEDYLTDLIIKYGIDKKPASFIQEFFNTYKSEIIKAKPLPGVTNFLNNAHKHKKKLVLVTSSKKDQAKAILDLHNWTNLFLGIVSEEDISNFKPNPEPYLLGAKKANAEPSKCVVFEDATNGVLSGKAANMFIIGIRAGNEIDQDLNAANTIVESFNNIVV